MLFNQSDLDEEIRELQMKIEEKRLAFDKGMKNGTEFQELKKLFVEIKELTKRQELCFEESNIQKEW
jgi:hypothetical protein